MYYRTTYRLGDGIARIMRWVMQAKVPAVKLSWLLTIVWMSLIAYQVPTAIGLVNKALEMEESTNKVAPEKECVCRKHVSFVSEAVARKFESPK